MQTFDQSLMTLLKKGVITYEEALRQSTNPDDFALRVSGIASTTDSSWDGFEGGARRPPRRRSFAGRPRPSARRPRRRRPPPQQLGRIPPPPGTPRPAGAQPPQPAADDDFQIERF